MLARVFYISYNSNGSRSGSAKNVNLFPVISSTLTGSQGTPLSDNDAMAFSISLTLKAKCRNPQDSGLDGLCGDEGKKTIQWCSGH